MSHYSATLRAHPINQGDSSVGSIDYLYLCTINNQGLLALAQLTLPAQEYLTPGGRLDFACL